MQQFYEYVLEILPNNNDLDIFILLEEASSFYVPLLPLALANCRKYRVGTIVALQSVGQLEKLYSKDAQNIVNNCITKIYLPGLTSTDTRELENLSGKATYKDHKGIEKTMSLITVDKARIIHKNRTFILHSNMPIIKGRSLAYFRSASDRACCKIPPMELKGDIPDMPIALLTDSIKLGQIIEEVAA
jgi:type IV secretory pathway TraG/TraD family ATPase VirD4